MDKNVMYITGKEYFRFGKEYLRYKSKQWIKPMKRELIINAVILFIVLAFYLAFRSRYYMMMGIFTSFPAEILALLGIGSGTETGNFLFLVKWVCLFLNVIILRSGMVRTARIVAEADEKDTTYRLVNQWFTRREYALLQYIESVFFFGLELAIWENWVMIIGFIGCINVTQRLRAIGNAFSAFGLNLIVGTILISYVYMRSITSEKSSEYLSQTLVDELLGGCLILGNLYKVADLAALVTNTVPMLALRFAKVPFQTISNVLAQLRRFTPMVWMNPLMPYLGLQWISMLLIAVLAGLAVWYAIRTYDRKSI